MPPPLVHSLDGNNIGPEGATAIADSLRVNTALIDLNLCMNKIEDDGVIALAPSAPILLL